MFSKIKSCFKNYQVTVFLDWKTQMVKIIILSKLTYSCNTFPIKILAEIFIAIGKLILSYYEKAKKLEWSKIFEIRRINFLNSDVNFKLPTGEVMTHID